MREIMLAVRQLRKAPGFAVVAILTLALGIGASTAVFTAVDSIILKPLAYRDSGQLVAAWERVKFLGPSMAYSGPNPRHVELWQKRATDLQVLAIARQESSGLALGTEHPRMTAVVAAQANLLDVLKVMPMAGRAFRREDEVKGRDKIALLTQELAQNSFGGAAQAIGKTVRLGNEPYVVIGVLPGSFRFPSRHVLDASPSKQGVGEAPEPQVFVPLVEDFDGFSWNGEYGNFLALGRLQPGATVAGAQAQLQTILGQIIDEEMPPKERSFAHEAIKAYVQPLQEAVVGQSGPTLWLLMSAVLGLLLIACVNLANAQVGRALSREREAAVRSALGASKRQLLWSSLAESLALATIGGVLGVVLAREALELFRAHAPIQLPRASEIHLNGTVLLFSVALTIGAALLFGAMPALKWLASDPQNALQRGSGRAAGNRQNRRRRSWLIGLQVFACTALLLVTGLFAKSLWHLLSSDKGFSSEHVTLAEADLSETSYRENPERIAFDDGALRNVRALPGVRSAALTNALPLGGDTWIEEIQRADRPDRDGPLVNLRWVSDRYFETLREPLKAGRFITEADRTLRGAVISESTAQAEWPNENPLGRQMQVEGRKFTVVGVVADAHSNSLKLAPPNMVYVHYADRPQLPTYFLVRSAQPAEQVTAAVRRAIWQQDPSVTTARVKTMESQIKDSLAPERFETSVLVSLGAGALLLAMLGIYRVLSYAMAGRKQEIGVRMALGATKQRIYSLTMSDAAAPVLSGLVGGWLVSLAIGQFVRAMLYGVECTDAMVTAIVVFSFLAAALAAAFIPARRAASIDPMEALRAE